MDNGRNQWVFDLEINIFSNVATIAKPKLKKKYKSMNFDTAFTTVEKNLDKDPVFPTIYIHEMPGLERGADLEGTSVNAVQKQYRLTSLQTQSRAMQKGLWLF